LLLPAEIIPASSHVSSYFDIGVLNNNLGSILASYWKTLFLVYSGDASIYSIRIDLLGALLVAALFGILISLARSRSSMTNKFLVLILTLMALLFPFASGLLMNGLYQMRFLLGVPIVVAGLTMFGLGENPRMYKLLLVFLATICIFQFTISTNRLFMSSYLTFQNDRLLASRLIERIEEAKIKASPNEKLTTLEVIGAFPVPPSSALIFRREYIGASFFNNYKNSQRAVLFLETLDYQGLRMAASLKRYQLLQIGSSMPIWPADGSVRLAGDTVLIKFGPYTEVQKQAICAVPEAKKISILNDAFCR